MYNITLCSFLKPKPRKDYSMSATAYDFSAYQAAYQAAGILTEPERRAYRLVLGNLTGKTLLEVGCGDLRFGRQFLRVSDLSYIGIDANLDAVNYCLRTFPDADVRHVDFFDFRESVDDIIFPFSTFPYLSLEEQEGFVQHGVALLTEGGRLIIDTMLPERNGRDRAMEFEENPLGLGTRKSVYVTLSQFKSWAMPHQVTVRNYPFSCIKGRIQHHSLIVVKK